MTQQSTGPTPFERGATIGNMLMTAAGLMILLMTGIIWNNNQITMHGYRIDKLESGRADDRKEILAAMSDMAGSFKILNATVTDIKTDLAIQHRDDTSRDERIKVILDRMEKR